MLIDGHCHPTDHPETLESIYTLDLRMAAMSTRFDDLDLVAEIGTRYPEKVTPAFGLHPWFSHLLRIGGNTNSVDKATHYKSVLEPTPADDHPILQLLPEPIALEDHIRRIEALLTRYPNSLVGEVGLDKQFKVKHDGVIYPFRVSMAHQRTVLRAQLGLARSLNRSVSLHGVGSPQALYDEVSSMVAKSSCGPEYSGSLCLHSYGGSADFYSQLWRRLPVKVYLSMTTLISERLDPQRLKSMLSAAVPSLVLTESDFNRSDPSQIDLVKGSLRLLANHFGWSEEEAEKIVERNFNEFIARCD